MKTLIVALVLLGSFSAFAESVIVGGFGTDGASGQPIPTSHSALDAKAVHEALHIPEGLKGDKVIVMNEAELKCEKPKMGMTRLSANCQITVRTRPTGAQISGTSLVVHEKFAEKIFKALDTASAVRMGATTRTAGNIQCTQVIGMRTSYTCKFVDVIAREFNM